MRRALFLDRDGVINVDHGYVGHPRDFEVIDRVFDALRQAQSLGYALIVVTNQSGIARGYFSQADYSALEEHMRALFQAEGIGFADIYHCPHGPGDACVCRKPEPGMILRAAHEHRIDLAASVLIGDKDSDMQAAKTAGVGRAILAGHPHPTLWDIIEGCSSRTQ